MANTAKTFPSSATTHNNGTSSNSWGNASNILSNDTSVATCSGEAEGYNTDSLVGYNFGFAIPTGARIDSFVVTIRASCDKTENGFTTYLGSESASVFTINGTAAGSSGIPTTLGDVNVSGSLWSGTWTADMVNNSTFGVQISSYNNGPGKATTNVDSISVTVYYTPTYLNTINGLAKASVKRVNGLAIASIKGIDGLT